MLLALAPRASAQGAELDLRWRGVELADLPGDEVALVAEAVRRQNPGHFDSVLSVAWLERSVGIDPKTRTSTELLPAPRYLVQIVGRDQRFAATKQAKKAAKRGEAPLGVVI